MKKRQVTVYTYRGHVERGARYEWRRGYSKTGDNGEIYYPWLTRRECQHDAQKRGHVAKFVEEATRGNR